MLPFSYTKVSFQNATFTAQFKPLYVASIGHPKLHNYNAVDDQYQLIPDAVHSNPVAGMVSHKVDSINSGYVKCN